MQALYFTLLTRNINGFIAFIALNQVKNSTSCIIKQHASLKLKIYLIIHYY
jgi:hypothetical protein